MKSLPKFSFLLAVVMLTSQLADAQQQGFRWPNGAKAAVCLTYDDAMTVHLDNAIPDLNSTGLYGTFFLEGNHLTVARLDEWRKAQKQGHELGNHSIFHPCSAETLPNQAEDFASEDYTVKRILQELLVMNTLLHAMDGKTERTFAYNCGETEFGGKSIIDTLRKSGLFFAVRGTEDGVITDFKNLDFFEVPSWGKTGGSAQEFISMAEKAKAAGGLIVFTFHGVGGQWLSVDRDEHMKLLQYLSKSQGTYWVAPFMDVMKHIASEQKRLGWK